MSRWNCAHTVARYEQFCERHSRYQLANEALLARAELRPGMRMLDLAAGTGRTAASFLPKLSADSQVLCVEPADAMRQHGSRRLRDPRVRWAADLPEPDQTFDLIVCGAAIWQLQPLQKHLRALCLRLSDRGQLLFNVPALYLGTPDPPGRGSDPDLIALSQWLLEHAPTAIQPSSDDPAFEPMSPEGINNILDHLGLEYQRWSFRTRLSEQAQADWFRIPVIGDGMLPGMDNRQRDLYIETGLAAVATGSWKWEYWFGWRAQQRTSA